MTADTMGLLIEATLAVVGWMLWVSERGKRLAADEDAERWRRSAEISEFRFDAVLHDRKRSPVSARCEGYAAFSTIEDLTR